MKFSPIMCNLMRIQNPHVQYLEGCDDPSMVTSTTTTTTTSSTTVISAYDPPKNPQITPESTKAQFITSKPSTTPTPVPKTSSHTTPTPKVTTPSLQPVPDTTPSPSFTADEKDWGDKIINFISDMPAVAWVLSGLTLFGLLLTLVAICCEKLADRIREVAPGECRGCIGCLDDTGYYANLGAMIVRGVRGILASLLNKDGRTQQVATRDDRPLLPGLSHSREDRTLTTTV